MININSSMKQTNIHDIHDIQKKTVDWYTDFTVKGKVFLFLLLLLLGIVISFLH